MLESLLSYVPIALVLHRLHDFHAVVVNPIWVWCLQRRILFPLVFRCLRESGVTAFFTRSSAANIPVNMNLCRDLKLDEEVYAVSIPVGATINMSALL